MRCRAVLLVLGCLLVACSPSDDGEPSDAIRTEGQEDAAAAGDADEDSVPSGRLQLSGYADVHRTGMSVEATAVSVDEGGHLLIEVDAVNARSANSSFDLNAFAVMAEDDLGNRYPVHGVEDDELDIPKDHRLRGTLAFEGPIDPGARRVSLGLNQARADEGLSPSSTFDSLSRNTPFLVADLPLPGVGLEDEAVNPDGDALEHHVVEVDQTQQGHSNDEVTVTVVEYETDGRTLHVHLEAVNRSGRRVRVLANRPHLEDDQGRDFDYLSVDSDEQDERRLTLESGEEAEATLAFRRVLAADAEELHLTLNGFALSRDFAGSPGFEFTMPAPDRDDEE